MSRSKVTTAHNPSPYLRRCRIPQLNTVRPFDDPCTPEDEDGKMELIREKMTQLSQRTPASQKLAAAEGPGQGLRGFRPAASASTPNFQLSLSRKPSPNNAHRTELARLLQDNRAKVTG